MKLSYKMGGILVIGVIVLFVLYQFLFADRRSRLSVEGSKGNIMRINNKSLNSRKLVREGQLNFEVQFASRNHLSTISQAMSNDISLQFHEKSANTASGYSHELADGLRNGWKGLLAFVTLLVTIWPLLVIAGIGSWLYVRRRRVTFIS